MAAPAITKGGPKPLRKDYKNDDAFVAAIKKWEELNRTATSPSSLSPKPAVESENVEPNVVVKSGDRNDWSSFTDGTIIQQPGNPAVGQTPYVSDQPEGAGTTPRPVLILAGTKPNTFRIVTVESFLNSLVPQINRNPNNIQYWKTQLRSYYKSESDYATSLRGGPITDKDTAFFYALTQAVNEISADNRSVAVESADAGTNTAENFYDINSWIKSRISQSPIERTSQSTRNFTKRADAIADFMREVQIQVGDSKLVDNVDALAEAYWQKIQRVEKDRMGRGVSIRDPITGITSSISTGYQMPSAQLLQEWRVEFITKGAINKDKTIISTGIRNVKALDLQDAGGEIGDNYTKLKSYSFNYGIRLSDEQLKTKAAEASLPGSSIEEQKRTIQLASRALYKSLSPFIEGGLMVKDIGSQFIKAKVDELELSDGSVDIFDPDVQSALTADKLPGALDYVMQLRSNPAYRNTKKFNEGAAGLLDGILRMFGKVG